MKKKVVGSMSEWSGMLQDLFRQISDGSITKQQLQIFLERKDPIVHKTEVVKMYEEFYQSLNIQPDFTGLVIPTKP